MECLFKLHPARSDSVRRSFSNSGFLTACHLFISLLKCIGFTSQRCSDFDSWKYNFIARKINLKLSHPLYLCLFAALLHCTPVWHEGRENLSHAYGWRCERWLTQLCTPQRKVCLLELNFSHISFPCCSFFCAFVLFQWNARQHKPSISSKLLPSLASCLLILPVIRLNIHSWGDLMSHYNSPSVMISAPLPSAPVRSNLRPLQEAIIRWGKSYVSLTMLHFHYNSSHSLLANSYLLQTIRVYCIRGARGCAASGINTHSRQLNLQEKVTNEAEF